MRPRALLCLCLCALALAGPAPAAAAQEALRESAVKAAFLFKFTSFVEWPPGAFQRPDQPLVIGVLGDSDVAQDLERIAEGRVVDGHPIAVRHVASAPSAADVHVLYIASQRPARLRAALEAVAGPVLVVTEQPGALQAGSVINFSREQGHVRFSASLTSAQARHLKLSSRLLSVAAHVEGHTP
jgi:hypothetical protein